MIYIKDHEVIKLLKGGVQGDKEGWLRIHISDSSFHSFLYPHRLVMKVFGPPTPKNHHIFHINKDRTDNYIGNLSSTSKRFHKRRVARWKREGTYWVYYRGARYNHDRYSCYR